MNSCVISAIWIYRAELQNKHVVLILSPPIDHLLTWNCVLRLTFDYVELHDKKQKMIFYHDQNIKKLNSKILTLTLYIYLKITLAEWIYDIDFPWSKSPCSTYDLLPSECVFGKTRKIKIPITRVFYAV